MAYNTGPMFSPPSFEMIFLPAYRRMVKAYKQAGAKYVFFHSTDNTGTLIDGPIEKVQAEKRETIDVARDGGGLIGSGSIGPHISLENFAATTRRV